ncbi:MAG: hypothetical protein R3C11_22210 [Planctomycetaceae bacterium]
MKQMIWKELRELEVGSNISWLYVPAGVVRFFGGRRRLYFESTDFLVFISFTASLGGFAFGLIQGYRESAQDRWAFLLHRAAANQIAAAKLLVGCGIQFVCWVTLLVGSALYLKLNNSFNHPFYWFTLLPALLVSLVFVPMYALGLLFFIWKTRRKIVKPMILGFVLSTWMTLASLPPSVGWSGLWGMAFSLAVLTLLSISAFLASYRSYGELESAGLPSRLFLHSGVVVTLTAVFMIVAQLVNSMVT